MRNISRFSLGIALVAATMVAASTASAQATVNASATVASALTVNTRDLAFGTVFPGVNKSVAFTDAASGRFEFLAEAGATISLSWGAIPANLVGGSSNLAFDAAGLEGCSVVSSTAVGCGSPNYSFANGNLTMPAGAAGTQTAHYIFVRGTVAPTAGQAAGAYSATLSVTAAYTGS